MRFAATLYGCRTPGGYGQARQHKRATPRSNRMKFLIAWIYLRAPAGDGTWVANPYSRIPERELPAEMIFYRSLIRDAKLSWRTNGLSNCEVPRLSTLRPACY